eukprot:Lankesteria_metandrocarpae@DN4404_c1_g1_i1.p1
MQRGGRSSIVSHAGAHAGQPPMTNSGNTASVMHQGSAVVCGSGSLSGSGAVLPHFVPTNNYHTSASSSGGVVHHLSDHDSSHEQLHQHHAPMAMDNYQEMYDTGSNIGSTKQNRAKVDQYSDAPVVEDQNVHHHQYMPNAGMHMSQHLQAAGMTATGVPQHYQMPTNGGSVYSNQVHSSSGAVSPQHQQHQQHQHHQQQHPQHHQQHPQQQHQQQH